MPHTLGLCILLDESNLLFSSASKTQVTKCLFIDWEDRTCRSIFRRHISNCCAISHWHRDNARTVELNKFSNNPMLAEHLCDGQSHICSSCSDRKFSRKFEANYAWNQHRNWLTKESCFCLDSTHAPTEYAKAINHRCM